VPATVVQTGAMGEPELTIFTELVKVAPRLPVNAPK
jgi:hypothetical protein